MGALLRFYNTTVGKKVTMALTGLAMVGFLIGHMVGNLKAFAGYEQGTGIHKLDLYAAFLRDIGAQLFGHSTLLWGARIGLLSAVVLHVMSAISLAKLKATSRPVGYQGQKYRSATWASRSMYIGGFVIFFFIIFHILHFTTGTLHFQGFQEGAVFSNLVKGFGPSLVVAFYIVSLIAVGFHLYHGSWSLFQTLGLDSPRWNPLIRIGAKVLSTVLVIGFLSVPLSVFFGLLP